MAIVYRRSNWGVGSAQTTRYLLITTGSAQAVVSVTGSQQMQVFNQGTAGVLWGADTLLAVGSGGIIYPGASKSFEGIVDTFTVYFRADTAQGANIAVTDFFV